MSISQSKHSRQENDSSAGVDPARVPGRVLSSGAKMPVIGLGTYGSEKYSPQLVAEAVVDAAGLGYRHFDCAEVYGNEKEIGEALTRIMLGSGKRRNDCDGDRDSDSDCDCDGDGGRDRRVKGSGGASSSGARLGVRREELFITSKLWNNHHAERDVIPACEKSLADLQLDYLDLYLIHWPFPNYHAPGCDVTARAADARPYIHENYMKTWRQLEKLVERGLARNIGVSNMTLPKMKLLLRDAEIRPAVNQIELNPHLQQPELIDYLLGENVLPVGYCPLGSPSRPERDRTPQDTVVLEEPLIAAIAGRMQLTPAAVCIKWAIQRGAIPIPFSVKRRQYLDSLQAALSAPLSGDDMEAISRIDKNCRLIKGQVFLWKQNQSWQDLWDLDGTITPA